MERLITVGMEWLCGALFALSAFLVAGQLGQDITYFQAVVLATVFVIALRVRRDK